MARGCAVVSSKTEGGNFVVGPKEGFLYDYKYLDGLKEALLTLLKDDKLRVRMQKHNREKAKDYLVSNVVKQFEELYS
jgi:glycosyltransferase involved in cell wall biosynthesis